MTVDLSQLGIALIGAAGAAWAAWLTYLMRKTHIAVNSERTAMQKEVARLNDVNAALGATVARLEGVLNQRDSDHAIARKR